MSESPSQLEDRLSLLKKRLASTAVSPVSSNTSDPITSPIRSSFPSAPDSPAAISITTSGAITSSQDTPTSIPSTSRHPLTQEMTTPDIPPAFSSPNSLEPTPDEEKIPIGKLYRTSKPLSLPPSDPDCVCRHLLDEQDWRKCSKCQGGIERLLSLAQELDFLRNEVEQHRQSLAIASSKQDESAVEISRLKAKLELSESQLKEKSVELKRVRKDLEVIGEKLIDEIEKRAELQHSKEAVQDELEELTKSLFEEANQMVANEARQRHQHQEREVTLKKELDSLKKLYSVEQEKVKELRLKLSFANEHVERLASTIHDKANRSKSEAELNVIANDATDALHSPLSPVQGSIVQQLGGNSLSTLTDELQFQQFKELLDVAPKFKMTKLVSLLFMRNALEDDVTPCLRFGGNPRTSTKKFIDAIISNTCFVEEMSAEQIQYLENRDSQLRQSTTSKEYATASSSPSPEKNRSSVSALSSANQSSDQLNVTGRDTPPTQSLFNKTVFERLTQAIASANLASLGSAGESLITNVKGSGAGSSYAPNAVPGCSACTKQDEPYQYHFKISDISEDLWYPICLNCRDRLMAVCDFYNFVRNIRQGIFSSRTPQDLYIEVLSLKRRMFYARLGLKVRMPPHSIITSRDPAAKIQGQLEGTWDTRSPFLLYANVPTKSDVQVVVSDSIESNLQESQQELKAPKTEPSVHFSRPSVFEGTGSIGSLITSSSIRLSTSVSNLAHTMSNTSSDEEF